MTVGLEAFVEILSRENTVTSTMEDVKMIQVLLLDLTVQTQVIVTPFALRNFQLERV